MGKVISREELKAWMDEGKDFDLIEVLPADSFNESHLPQAVNIPLEEDEANFDREVASQVSDPAATVVVYCASPECTASGEAAGRIERLGYTNVYHYEGGKKEWKAAGYPVIEGRKAA